MKTSRILIVEQERLGGDMGSEARQATYGTIISLVAILGSSVGVYTGLKTETTEIAVKLKNVNQQVVKLDDYDLHLQLVLDKNSQRITRLESKVDNQQENYDKLAVGLSNLGKEIRVLSDALIRMEEK